MRPRIRHVLAVAALVTTTVAAAPTAPIDDAQSPADLAIDAALTAAGVCDEFDDRLCLLPFPNDHFTALDGSTPTGRRVDLNPFATPRTIAGKPIDTTEWNRNDGFSPGALVLTYVPGLDLTATLGLDATPETGVGTDNDPFAQRDAEPDHMLEAPELSLADDSPIVLLDADTGERFPFWAELDEHPETIADGEDRTLLIRPLENLTEGHRYIVALRDLVDADGNEIAPTASFAAMRDELAEPAFAGKQDCESHPGKGSGNGKGKGGDNRCSDNGRVPFPAPADIDPADRTARYDDIFLRLSASGVDATDLYLAWDFHVASEQNLAGRALAIRDDAFAQLGDDDLSDLQIDGVSPEFAITGVEDGESDGYPTRTVTGTVTVPNYLDRPQDGANAEAAGAAEDGYDQLPAELRDNDPFVGDLIDLADEVPVVLPGSRLFYGEPAPGPMATPVQNPVVPTTDAEFVCKFRTDLSEAKDANDPSQGTTAAKPTLYGHGLLGGKGEAEGSSTGDLRRAGHAMCGVDWIGMATEDITTVALILNDVSFFPSLADRAQQGFLNFMFVGRTLIHPDGFATHPAFQDASGEPLIDVSELFYNGNSQGGIMGGALTALAPDFTKSVLGVPGMNYATLLNRSVDWEGEFINPEDPGIPAYASFMYNTYPDKVEQQLVFSIMQMLWDRGEGNGYAAHMTSDPYPNTPAHQVLLEPALGDYQVTNHAAEVQARTIGADFLTTNLAPGRHWERDYALGTADAPFGLTTFVTSEDGTTYAPSGSAIVYWDSGNPLPYNGNVPPADLHQDPHSDPRKDDRALVQKVTFYNSGFIVDVLGGEPYWNQNCRHSEYHPGC